MERRALASVGVPVIGTAAVVTCTVIPSLPNKSISVCVFSLILRDFWTACICMYSYVVCRVPVQLSQHRAHINILITFFNVICLPFTLRKTHFIYLFAVSVLVCACFCDFLSHSNWRYRKVWIIIHINFHNCNICVCSIRDFDMGLERLNYTSNYYYLFISFELIWNKDKWSPVLSTIHEVSAIFLCI